MTAPIKRCGRVGCPNKATRKLQPKYGRPWYGCDDHQDGMQKVLFIGQPSTDASVSSTPVTGKKHREPYTGTPPTVVRLNWGIKSETPGSWHFRSRPCITCDGPTPLRNPDRQHQHKACAERMLERELAST